MSSQTTINDMIPAEVMGEIFLQCIPPNPLERRQPNIKIAPMLLCRVCSHWRDIALKTPHIWTYLYHVGYVTPPNTFDSRDFAFLQWWCESAKDVPISLRLAFRVDHRRRLDVKYRQIKVANFLEHLARFLSNARYINLDYNYQLLLRALPSVQRPTCPNLDTIVFQGRHDRALRLTGTLISQEIIPVAPKGNLRRILLEGIFLEREHLSSDLIDFSIVTHLHIEMSASLDVWFSLLQQTANLVYGSFSITLYGEFNVPVPRPTVLPYLRQMVFENLGPELRRSFLEGFHLPSLIALHIDHCMPPDIKHLHRILSSTPALRTLQLGEPFTDTSIPSFIFIEGDLGPIDTPLSNVVPYLSSIYFQYSMAMSSVFLPENRTRVISALTGEWLGLGRPGSNITRVYLSTSQGVIFPDAVALVQDLQIYVPAGVKFAVRPNNLPDLWTPWKQQHHDFINAFEDLILDEI